MAAVPAAPLIPIPQRGPGRISLWAPVVIYMAALFAVSAQSSPPMPPSVSDKLLHVLAYGGLGTLVCRAVGRGLPARVTWRRALATLLVTIGYAATDELHQMAVPGRSADVYDLAADAVGAALALMACWAWGILGRSRSRIPDSTSQP